MVSFKGFGPVGGIQGPIGGVPYQFEIQKDAEKPERQKILEEGIRITTGDRNRTYGDPYDSLVRLADLWNAYLGMEDAHLSPHDVAVMMVLLKLGRISSSPLHEDNYVDAATYAAIAGEVAKRHFQPGDIF